MVPKCKILNDRHAELRVFEQRVEDIVSSQVEHPRVLASDRRILVRLTLLQKQFAVDCSASQNAHDGVAFAQLDHPLDDNEDTLIIIAFAEYGLTAIELQLVGAGGQLRQRLGRNGVEDLAMTSGARSSQ